MAITKTVRLTRPSTEVAFYTESGLPHLQATNTIIDALADAGKHSKVETISDDGLTQTRVFTYADLDTLNAADTANGIATTLEFQTYRISNNFDMPSYATAEDRANAWSLDGINQPYRVTTTYTFPAGESYLDTFVSSLEAYEHYGKIHDLYINGDDVVLVHQYLNSADETANQYLDMFFVPQLAEKGVTRTIKYELV